MNAMIAMTNLFHSHPDANAPDDTVAAWYSAKGRMHEQLAQTSGADTAKELAYAAAAHEHARRLELRAAAAPQQRAA